MKFPRSFYAWIALATVLCLSVPFALQHKALRDDYEDAVHLQAICDARAAGDMDEARAVEQHDACDSKMLMLHYATSHSSEYAADVLKLSIFTHWLPLAVWCLIAGGRRRRKLA